MDGLIRQGRDLRADVFRGFALWVIFVNHTPGNWLGFLTPRNYVLADATETFVLLAGYAAGIAYGLVLDRQGWAFAATRIMGRVFTLYVAHIFLLVVFTAQVGYSAAALDSTVYLDEMHLDPFSQEPYRALLEALLLRYQPSFLNILPLYIVLLALFALALPLLRRPWLMLVVSFAFYLAVRHFAWSLPAWQGDGGWFFNPLAWQVLFFVGCAIGYRPPGGAPVVIPYRRWVAALCGVQLLIGAVVVALVHFFWEFAQERLPGGAFEFLAGIDKTALHPLRLLSMLSLTYLVAHFVRREAAWLHARWAAPFVLMGQQALPVFCSGIALSFLGRVALEWNDRGPMQLAVNLMGAVLLVAIAALTAWYAAEKRTPRPAAVSALPATAPADRS